MRGAARKGGPYRDLSTFNGNDSSHPAPPIHPNSAIRAVINILHEAHLCALDAGRDKWDFAVEIRHLRQYGLRDSHFRWLVCKSLVEHAEEVMVAGQYARTFQRTGELTFTEATCFVLTRGDVEYSADVLHDAPVLRFAIGAMDRIADRKCSLPNWDVDRHELNFGGYLVKRFKHKSRNQETILAAFEEEGWPAAIPDPLPQNGDTDPKRRLNDTIKGLNHHQENKLIRFRGDGTGEGVIWENRMAHKCG